MRIHICKVHLLFILVASSAFVGTIPVQATEPSQPQLTEVFVSGTRGYHTYRIPSIVLAPNGSLIAICEGRKDGRGDAGDIDLLCRISNDEGQTWGSMHMIWDDGDNTCGNPCAVVDRSTGTIWLLMTHNLGDDHERDIIRGTSTGTRTVWICKSVDNGQSWTQPRDITAQVKAPNWTWYATGPGAGIQLDRGSPAGRLVIPCDHIEAKTEKYFSHVIYSDDHGETWNLGGTTPRDRVNECEVVELSDGRLLLNMRNYDSAVSARQIALSDDGGASWHDQRHDAMLIEPRCQASIRRMRWPVDGQPGLIFFSNPADRKSRVNMMIRGSADGGLTWPYARVLYPQSSAYSCLVALPDDAAGCLFEVDNYKRIVYAQFKCAAFTQEPDAPKLE